MSRLQSGVVETVDGIGLRLPDHLTDRGSFYLIRLEKGFQPQGL
jgi:hypothetical protein